MGSIPVLLHGSVAPAATLSSPEFWLQHPRNLISPGQKSSFRWVPEDWMRHAPEHPIADLLSVLQA